MIEIAGFTNFNFKLTVINELMYQQTVLQPRFDLRRFVNSYTARRIDIDEEGFDVIPEVREYFATLQIPLSCLEGVEVLYQDGGNEIYMQLCPFWDGEDDRFNIRSAEDAALLPRLKRVTLFYDSDHRIIEEFERRGVQAKWL